MLRRSLLALSESKPLRRWMEQSPVGQRLTSRFIAGRTLEDELAVVRKLASEGTLATLDFLGENVSNLDEVEASQRNYLAAFEPIHSYGATVSIKLTQFGLDLSRDVCVEKASALVEWAQRFNTRVEIDMESSVYTQQTIDIVRELNRRFPGRVRVAIQAYLYRTEKDIDLLSSEGIPVRLCKGAYREPSDIAYPSKADVDQAYARLARKLLTSGTYPAIAGHDDKIIDGVLDFVNQQKITPDRFEFQMLYGIRRDRQRDLLARGYRLRLYVPYGDAWFPYFMRRLAERPANLLFIARNMLRN